MRSFISPRCLVSPLAGLLLLFTAGGCPAEEMRIASGIPYADPGDGDVNLVSLDIYAPKSGSGYPVVVYVHGGGWRRGDKSAVHAKPGRFTSEGYVFVSVNYRLSPDVLHPVHVQDVANAIAWVHDNIAAYGGEPAQLFLMGHSAGAHLVALTGVDTRYLENAGKDLAILAGVVALDSAVYDIPARLSFPGAAMTALLHSAFGVSPATHADASPIHHVMPGRAIPPFLLVYVASREVARSQTEAFAEALTHAGALVEVYSADDKTHMTLNRDLGLPHDPPTEKVLGFLFDLHDEQR